MKQILALHAILILLLTAGCNQQSRYAQFGGFAQGGTWSVKANLAGVKTKPAEIQKQIEAILEEIDTTLSGYNKASQLSRFNAGEPVQTSPMFNEVLQAGIRFWEETDGALDCAAGPLFDIWGFGFKNDSLPSDDLVRQTMARCGMARLICSENGPKTGTNSLKMETCSEKQLFSATKDGSRIQLNFNAIAQGYSCDKVAEYLYSIGIKDMLVDIGEIFCDGYNPSGKPWRVGVDMPEDGNNTPGAKLNGIWESNGGPQGIVTSGNYRKYYIKDGAKYSHTVDPRTGYPVQHNLLSATIIAPSAMEADAYATYCMVIGYEASRDFILSRDDLEGYLIRSCTPEDTGQNKHSMTEWASPGFNLTISSPK